VPSNRLVYDFSITLLNTDPSIWRRIVVPENYSFWDLHVGIQDAMGWFDCHLHAFRFGKGRAAQEIGIPDDEGFSDNATLPGWETPIKEYFDVGKSCVYEYDFGDGWIHEVVLRGIAPAEKGTKYPVCVDGAMACPPEDCGGIPGYYHLLEVLSDPEHEEYEELLAWLGGAYDPAAFSPSEVTFESPKKRLRAAFPDGI
jgi:hypothetical protein